MPENASLSAAHRTRIVRMLGILGSNFDGERAAAAAKVAYLVRSLGLTWDDLIRDAYGPAPDPEPRHGEDWRADAAFALRHREWLTPWEIDFTGTLLGFARISERQSQILAQITAKIPVARTGAP